MCSPVLAVPFLHHSLRASQKHCTWQPRTLRNQRHCQAFSFPTHNPMRLQVPFTHHRSSCHRLDTPFGLRKTDMTLQFCKISQKVATSSLHLKSDFWKKKWFAKPRLRSKGPRIQCKHFNYLYLCFKSTTSPAKIYEIWSSRDSDYEDYRRLECDDV
jgi:hypothetical protein